MTDDTDVDCRINEPGDKSSIEPDGDDDGPPIPFPLLRHLYHCLMDGFREFIILFGTAILNDFS